jgi:hypothetical protein
VQYRLRDCPVLPGAKRLLRHVFQDPDQPGLDEAALIKAFRRVRDEIGDFVRGIVQGMCDNSWRNPYFLSLSKDKRVSSVAPSVA